MSNTIAEATSLGWVPLEEFKGDPNRWVDAEVFVERGHTVMPLLKKNNERLEGTVSQQAAEISRLQGMMAANQESITALQAVHREATIAAVARAKSELLKELRTAKEDGDLDREVELTDRLTMLQAPVAQASSPISTAIPPTPAEDPAFTSWKSLNPWFEKDDRKTLRAISIAQGLRADPDYDNVIGKSFFEEVSRRLDNSGPTQTSKVGSSTKGSGTEVNGYNDLPPEAKAACDKQAKTLVGEGRAFKTMADWRKYYVDIYSNS